MIALSSLIYFSSVVLIFAICNSFYFQENWNKNETNWKNGEKNVEVASKRLFHDLWRYFWTANGLDLKCGLLFSPFPFLQFGCSLVCITVSQLAAVGMRSGIRH